MKKFLSLLALLGLSSMALGAQDLKIVSIDSMLIMQKSEEGQALLGKIQKDIEGFQAELKKQQSLVQTEQTSLEKQAKVLSADAVEQKAKSLAKKRKGLEEEFAEKEESLRKEIQMAQMSLRERQMKAISSWSEKEGAIAVLDKATPGLLFVASSIDKTEDALKAVDATFKTAKVTVASATKAPTAIKKA